MGPQSSASRRLPRALQFYGEITIGSNHQPFSVRLYSPCRPSGSCHIQTHRVHA